MGDPKKQQKKFSKPGKPWEKSRIEEESIISTEFGLKNKQEIWKANSILRNFFAQTKKAISIITPQGEKEKAQLLQRLRKLGLIGDGAHVEDVLNITLRDILQRRLQSVVFNKGLARSMNQARQFIVHEHITVNGKKITVPGYLVTINEENTIAFSSKSNLTSADHPERTKLEPKEEKPKKTKKKTVKRKKVTVRRKSK